MSFLSDHQCSGYPSWYWQEFSYSYPGDAYPSLFRQSCLSDLLGQCIAYIMVCLWGMRIQPLLTAMLYPMGFKGPISTPTKDIGGCDAFRCPGRRALNLKVHKCWLSAASIVISGGQHIYSLAMSLAVNHPSCHNMNITLGHSIDRSDELCVMPKQMSPQPKGTKLFV